MSVAVNRTIVHYTLGLSKGGALLPETRTLAHTWQVGEPSTTFAERVLREDVLGKVTARRVLDIVRVFTLRYLQPTDTPARHLKLLLDPGVPGQVFTDTAFYYTALQDDLLRDYTVERYWPAVRDGAAIIQNRDVQEVIAAALVDGRIPTAWSEELRRDIAGRVLGVLTAFGLLAEDRPARRVVLPYAPADHTLVYLAYLLHERGITDASLANQPDWALFGLEPRQVWNRLESLSGAGWWILQRSGEVVRISWTYACVEEVLHAFA